MRKQSIVQESIHESSHHSQTFEDLMLQAQKPARYVGHEVNAVFKDPARVLLRVALAFPDVYEVGMSHLGLKILYSIVNERSELYAERVFAPWPDMEALLRDRGLPLVTMETGTPLSAMDLLGFSLQYELCASTVLQMIDLGGIPLRAEDRKQGDPFVIAGGPVAFNPVPTAPFFDAFVLGDGEEAILELADAHIRWKRERGSREDLLREWKSIPGVFVPSLHRPLERITRRVVADLDTAEFPSRPVVPFCETVHDRIGIEIARGCTRGCRFCQAGMLYRPVRERSPETILSLARRSVDATGWDELGLLSLSSGDYSRIGELIKRMTGEFEREKVALSLPSLRTDTFDEAMAEQIRKVRKTGFTLAPEAGTDRLRRIINKGNTEEDLERAVTTAFRQGWQSIKLYFMIGLPFETDEDLDGIIGLIRRASQWAGNKRITASVSTFVPKAHTPFQWAQAIGREEISRRQQYIKRYFRKGRVTVKCHDGHVSFLEAVLAAGDHHLADVIEAAYRKGARLDGWDEHLKFDVWMEAFAEAGIDPEQYLQAGRVDEVLPWDFIDTGVSREYLASEWEKARHEETTADCRFGDCAGCGMCDFESVFPRLSVTDAGRPSEIPDVPKGDAVVSVRRFRIRYGKYGRMIFLGHQDVIRVFYRAFRRGGLTLDFSKGFHPHPRLRFSPPIGLGIQSDMEYLDFDLVNCPFSAEEIGAKLALHLPAGMNLHQIVETSLNEGPVSAKIRRVTYEITFRNFLRVEEVTARVRLFDASSDFPVTQTRKGKARTRDLKEWITGLTVSDSVLTMTLKAGQDGSIHPLDAAAAILGVNREAIRSLRILKTSVGFERSGNHDEGPSCEQ